MGFCEDPNADTKAVWSAQLQPFIEGTGEKDKTLRLVEENVQKSPQAYEPEFKLSRKLWWSQCRLVAVRKAGTITQLKKSQFSLTQWKKHQTWRAASSHKN